MTYKYPSASSQGAGNPMGEPDTGLRPDRRLDDPELRDTSAEEAAVILNAARRPGRCTLCLEDTEVRDWLCAPCAMALNGGWKYLTDNGVFD